MPLTHKLHDNSPTHYTNINLVLEIRPQPLWNSTYTDKLRQDLLLNYDKFARPAQPDEQITVRFGFTVRHVDVNEMKSTFTVHCWLRMVRYMFTADFKCITCMIYTG